MGRHTTCKLLCR